MLKIGLIQSIAYAIAGLFGRPEGQTWG